MIKKEPVEKINPKKLAFSFKYAFSGIIETLKHEQNMILHFLISILVIFLGLFFRISRYEWMILIVTICLVFAAEIINTSIEALTDLVTDKKNELARITKDTAAGAVLVLAICAVIEGIIIFAPYLIELI